MQLHNIVSLNSPQVAGRFCAADGLRADSDGAGTGTLPQIRHRRAAQPRTGLGDASATRSFTANSTPLMPSPACRWPHRSARLRTVRLPDCAGAESARQRHHALQCVVAPRRERRRHVARRDAQAARRTDIDLRNRFARLLTSLPAARLAGGGGDQSRSATSASSSCRRRRWWRTSNPATWMAAVSANPGIPWPFAPAWAAASRSSAELDPGHPEKVLMVRRDFAEEREERTSGAGGGADGGLRIL